MEERPTTAALWAHFKDGLRPFLRSRLPSEADADDLEAAAFRDSAHGTSRLDAEPYAEFGGKASGTRADLYAEASPWKQRTQGLQLGRVGSRMCIEPRVIGGGVILEGSSPGHGSFGKRTPSQHDGWPLCLRYVSAPLRPRRATPCQTRPTAMRPSPTPQ